MRQLSIIVPKEQLHNFLSYASQKRMLHLIDFPNNNLPDGAEKRDSSNLLALSTGIRNRLLSLGSTFEEAPVPLEKVDAPVEDLDALADFLDRETARIEHSVRELEDSLAKLQGERERILELNRFLDGLAKVGVPLDTVGEKGFLAMLAGEASREAIQDVQRAIEEATYANSIFVITSSSERAHTFLCIFPAAFLEEARQSVSALGVKLEPSLADLPSDPLEAKESTSSRLSELEQSTKVLENQREELNKKHPSMIKALTLLAEVLEVRARALGGSACTQSTCVLRAWIPEDQASGFAEGAERSCQGLVSVYVEADVKHQVQHEHEPDSDNDQAASEDSPPTLVRVPGWTKPLQSVINSFGVPSYYETNPLLFMIVSYPVIYGLMFGDFGQGPLFILLGLFLWRLKKKGTQVTEIVQILVNGAELFVMLGIGITIFGFIFGDFFGFEPDFLLLGKEDSLRVPLFSPSHNLLLFMGITLLIGVGHYTLGLMLSVYTKLRRREISHAFFGPVCWVWFYLSGVFIVAIWVLNGFDFSAVSRMPWIFLSLAIPMALMAWKEGPIHWFEAFLSAASNTFSYLRIWALNISGFYLKVALFAVGGIPGAIAGNLLVMIIEGMIVFVQTLRLHWVEWFSKFYEGSGLAFSPYYEPSGWMVTPVG